MKEKQKRFFQVKENKDAQRFWNGTPVETSGEPKVEIKNKNFNKTPKIH